MKNNQPFFLLFFFINFMKMDSIMHLDIVNCPDYPVGRIILKFPNCPFTKQRPIESFTITATTTVALSLALNYVPNEITDSQI